MTTNSKQRNLLPEGIYQKLDAAEKQVLTGQVIDAEKGLQHIRDKYKLKLQINHRPHGK